MKTCQKRVKFCQIKRSKLSRNKHLGANQKPQRRKQKALVHRETNERPTTERSVVPAGQEIRFQSDSIPTVDRQDYYLLFDFHLFYTKDYIKTTVAQH